MTDAEIAEVREQVERAAWPLTVFALMYLAAHPSHPINERRQGRPASDWLGRGPGAKSPWRSYADVG